MGANPGHDALRSLRPLRSLRFNAFQKSVASVLPAGEPSSSPPATSGS